MMKKALRSQKSRPGRSEFDRGFGEEAKQDMMRQQRASDALVQRLNLNRNNRKSRSRLQQLDLGGDAMTVFVIKLKNSDN